MQPQRLLIADSSNAFRTALADALAGQFDIRLARDGAEAWALLQDFLPDILFLDVMLPGMDGITLLRRCAEAAIHPVVLVATRLYSEYIVSTLAQLGVSYILPKPCEVAAAAASVRELSAMPPAMPPMRRSSIADILLRLGVSRKLNGSRYLQQAICLFAKDPQQMLTKELYGAVGQHFHVSAAQVERSVRTAIHTAWLHRDERVWKRYFSTGEDGAVRRPTNGTFITRLSEFVFDDCAGIIPPRL